MRTDPPVSEPSAKSTSPAATAAAEPQDDPPGGAVRIWLSRLLRAGVTLDAVRELATGTKGVFRERYDIDPVGDPPPEPDIAAMLRALDEPVRDLERYCVAACTTPDDKGRLAAARLAEACRRLVDEPPGDVDRLAAALFCDVPLKDAESAPGAIRAAMVKPCVRALINVRLSWPNAAASVTGRAIPSSVPTSSKPLSPGSRDDQASC